MATTKRLIKGSPVTAAENDANMVIVDNNESKLSGIEDNATADQTGAEIKVLYEAENDTNAFTDALLSKINSITEIFTTALKTAYDTASSWVSTNGANVISHLSSTLNPHSVTKTQVGLGNADNTSDLSKPISTATQTALNTKQATLVSGTNVKTINSNSILGSGNLAVGNVTKVATPLVDQFAVWTGNGTIKGITQLKWGASDLTVTSGIQLNDGYSIKLGTDPEMSRIYSDGVDNIINLIDGDFDIRNNGVSIFNINRVTGEITASNIDQDVSSGAAPILDATNFTNMPSGSGDVVKVGTPVNNQLAIWTGDGTIEGDSEIVWNGTTLDITGGILLDALKRDHIRMKSTSETGVNKILGIFADDETYSFEIGSPVLSGSGGTKLRVKLENYNSGTTGGIYGVVDSDIRITIEADSVKLGTELDLENNSIGGTVQTATGDGATTIDWKRGNMFNFQFGAFNETFTFTAPTNPGTFILKLVQDSIGSRTATWPASVKWAGGSAPTLTTTATTGTDIITFYYDGTSYFAVDSLNFS